MQVSAACAKLRFFFRNSTDLFISVSILHHLFRKKERISTLEAHTL